MSQQVADILGEENRNVDLGNIKRGFTPPQLAVILVDKSGSMQPHTDAVIEGHRMLLDGLRGSSKCRRHALYMLQSLFSSTTEQLQKFTELSPDGVDSVVRLNRTNYCPDGGTALYQSVYQMLQDMTANLGHNSAQNLKTQFYLGVITDGEDTEGGVDPSDIRAVVQDMKSRGHITKSVICGISSGNMDYARFVKIKDELGFDEVIMVSNSPQEIRKAFNLMSASVAAAQIQ
jgi:hypothetical protein